MKQLFLLAFLSSCCLTDCRAADEGNYQATNSLDLVAKETNDFVTLPNRTNAIQLHFYTNASPNAAHLINTFEIEAFGEKLLSGPARESLQKWQTTGSTNAYQHNVLINELGPEAYATNGMTLIEESTGPDWSYATYDVTFAYRERVEQYRRGILYVAPDLLIIHDHVVAKDRVKFQMLLHPPAETLIDPVWHDLRLNTPKASLRVNTPSRRELRKWERIELPLDSNQTNTITVGVGPTNKMAQLDLVTVFAVQPARNKMDYTFKLVESNTAVGARIHRDGLPTLVAFRLDSTNANPSLDSFKFTGPVGVSVFRPKRNPR